MAPERTPPAQRGPVPAGDARIVLVTATPGVAQALGRTLVERRLAACVNVVPGMVSIYRWQAEVRADPESLLVIKTTRDRLDELLPALHELHPYEVPEALVLTPESAAAPYLAWLTAESRPGPT